MVLAAIGAGLGLLSIPMFSLFILEEAVQAASFGLFVLAAGKQWEKMKEHIKKYRELIDILEKAVIKIDALFSTPAKIGKWIGEIEGVSSEDTHTIAEQVIDTLITPYKAIVEAHRLNADAYEARAASEFSGINPIFFSAVQQLREDTKREKHNRKQELDRTIDMLAIEKKQKLDQLALEVKQELQNVASDVRKKVMKRNEADTARILIAQEKDKIEISIREEFNEKERSAKDIFFRQELALVKEEERKEIELRLKFYPAREITPPEKAVPEEIDGVVERVIDGDTAIVNGIRVRLAGINAPEISTSAGQQAALFLADLIQGKDVKVLSDAANQFDIYGRLLGVIMLGELNVNAEIIRNCHAGLFFVGDNKRVNRALFEEALRECLLRKPTPEIPPVIQPPSPPPILPLPPPQAPTTIARIDVRALDESGAVVEGAIICFDENCAQADNEGKRVKEYEHGTIIRISAKAPSGWGVLPSLDAVESFELLVTQDETHTFLMRKKPVEVPQPLPVIPVELDELSPWLKTFQIGLLEPRAGLRNSKEIIENPLIEKRIFTLSEITGEFESVGIRLFLEGEWMFLQEGLIAQYIIRPDRSIVPPLYFGSESREMEITTFDGRNIKMLVGVQPPTQVVGQPLGHHVTRVYTGWAGPPREIIMKGKYTYEIQFIGGWLKMGRYRTQFEVV